MLEIIHTETSSNAANQKPTVYNTKCETDFDAPEMSLAALTKQRYCLARELSSESAARKIVIPKNALLDGSEGTATVQQVLDKAVGQLKNCNLDFPSENDGCPQTPRQRTRSALNLSSDSLATGVSKDSWTARTDPLSSSDHASSKGSPLQNKRSRRMSALCTTVSPNRRLPKRSTPIPETWTAAQSPTTAVDAAADILITPKRASLRGFHSRRGNCQVRRTIDAALKITADPDEDYVEKKQSLDSKPVRPRRVLSHKGRVVVRSEEQQRKCPIRQNAEQNRLLRRGRVSLRAATVHAPSADFQPPLLEIEFVPGTDTLSDDDEISLSEHMATCVSPHDNGNPSEEIANVWTCFECDFDRNKARYMSCEMCRSPKKEQVEDQQ